MNRFASRTNNDDIAPLRRISRFFPLIIGIIVVAIFLYGIKYISSSSIDKQEESLRNAITRDVAQCYAVEGTYPPSLDYIEEHYGLTYNDDLFFVDYQPIGGNLFPDITIIKLVNQE